MIKQLINKRWAEETGDGVALSQLMGRNITENCRPAL